MKEGVARRSLSLATRKLTADYRFFQVIDSEEKAYWLGFFLADGCVTSTNRITVELSMRDREHLESFREALKAEHTIKTYRSGVSLTLRSSEMVADLERLGIGPRKSTREVVPPLPTKHTAHFWRGVFDGDGCVSSGQSGKTGHLLVMTLVGGHNIVKAFQQATLDISQSKSTISFGSGAWRYSLHGRGAARVFHWMYANAMVCLERKRTRGYELCAPGQPSAGSDVGQSATELVEGGTMKRSLVSTF
jgi:hypothetical protein